MLLSSLYFQLHIFISWWKYKNIFFTELQWIAVVVEKNGEKQVRKNTERAPVMHFTDSKCVYKRNMHVHTKFMIAPQTLTHSISLLILNILWAMRVGIEVQNA